MLSRLKVYNVIKKQKRNCNEIIKCKNFRCKYISGEKFKFRLILFVKKLLLMYISYIFTSRILFIMLVAQIKLNKFALLEEMKN